MSSLQTGLAALKQAIDSCDHQPGVYRMLDAKGNALYVGKAKSLKNRLTTYCNIGALPARLQRMVLATSRVELIMTRSEAEALLLESNLVKELNPRYNILLKDDKSFPYILFSGDHVYPRISKYRGARSQKGDYFGPFVSGLAVNEMMALLQRAFLLRPCADSVFKNRDRPCLQYQIKRCSAPCVNLISEENYAKLVKNAQQFLTGDADDIRQQMTAEMQQASEAMDFEKAASLRDRIRAINRIREQNALAMPHVGDADILALARDRDMACIQLFSYRGGRNFGSRSYFPTHTADSSDGEILETLIGRYYQAQPIPPTILISHPLASPEAVQDALCALAGRRIEVVVPQRGDKRQAMDIALMNAKQALARHITEQSASDELLERLAEVFGLESPPQRIEIYDNSHISGTSAIGAMVVTERGSFNKKAYRTFNIKQTALAPGDDYAMLREVLTRRLKRLLAEENAPKPDLLLIDGGAGQLSAAQQVLEELGISNICIASIAKGVDRNAGREWLHIPGKPPFQLAVDDKLLHFLQRLRDEAHRFAIGTHRNKRSKNFLRSELDTIPGIGGRRKKALLLHFGSPRAVAGASAEEISQVEGISTKVAQQIYDHFH